MMGTNLFSFLCFCQMMKSYIWLQNDDGSIQQVEQEVAKLCPIICQEIRTGVGSSKQNPISLPPQVNPAMLSLILDYCQFHQVPGRSNKVSAFKNCFFISRLSWVGDLSALVVYEQEDIFCDDQLVAKLGMSFDCSFM